MSNSDQGLGNIGPNRPIPQDKASEEEKVDPDKFKKVMKVEAPDESQQKKKRNLKKQEEEGEDDNVQEKAPPPPTASFSEFLSDGDKLDDVYSSQGPGKIQRAAPTQRDITPTVKLSTEGVELDESFVAPEEEAGAGTSFAAPEETVQGPVQGQAPTGGQPQPTTGQPPPQEGGTGLPPEGGEPGMAPTFEEPMQEPLPYSYTGTPEEGAPPSQTESGTQVQPSEEKEGSQEKPKGKMADESLLASQTKRGALSKKKPPQKQAPIVTEVPAKKQAPPKEGESQPVTTKEGEEKGTTPKAEMTPAKEEVIPTEKEKAPHAAKGEEIGVTPKGEAPPTKEGVFSTEKGKVPQTKEGAIPTRAPQAVPESKEGIPTPEMGKPISEAGKEALIPGVGTTERPTTPLTGRERITTEPTTTPTKKEEALAKGAVPPSEQQEEAPMGEEKQQRLKEVEQQGVEGAPMQTTFIIKTPDDVRNDKLAEEDKEEKKTPYIEANIQNAGYSLPQVPIEILPEVAPVEGTPSYAKLSPEIHALFEKMVGTIYIVQDKGDTHTEITLNMPNSPFNGAKIILDQYRTAPQSYNIQLQGSPEAVKAFNANIGALYSSFKQGDYSFEINNITTRQKPLIRRKGAAGGKKQ